MKKIFFVAGVMFFNSIVFAQSTACSEANLADCPPCSSSQMSTCQQQCGANGVDICDSTGPDTAYCECHGASNECSQANLGACPNCNSSQMSECQTHCGANGVDICKQLSPLVTSCECH